MEFVKVNCYKCGIEATLPKTEITKKKYRCGSGFILKCKYRANANQKKREPRKENFYKTARWAKLRAKAFALYGRACMKCGATEKVQVDHIKPRSKFPHLECDFNNLQILCEPCNSAKSNKNCSDYRTVPEPSVTKYFGIKDE